MVSTLIDKYGNVWIAGKDRQNVLYNSGRTTEFSTVDSRATYKTWTQIITPNNEKIKAIVKDETVVSFLTQSGEVYNCGVRHERLGYGDNRPTDDDITNYRASVSSNKTVKYPIKVNITNVKKVLVTYSIIFYLTNDNKLYCTGFDPDYSNTSSSTPKYTDPHYVMDLSDVIDIYGYQTTLIWLSTDGHVYCYYFSNNGFDAVGYGMLDDFESDEFSKYNKKYGKNNIIQMPFDEKIKKIYSAEDGTLFVTEDGKTYWTGTNTQGRFVSEKNSSSSAVFKPTEYRLKNFDLACMSSRSVIMYNNKTKTIYTTGSQANSPAGNGWTSSNSSAIKSKPYYLSYVMDFGSDLIELINIDETTFAITESGQIYACGYSDDYRLGKNFGYTLTKFTLLPIEGICSMTEVKEPKTKYIITKENGNDYIIKDGELYLMSDNDSGYENAESLFESIKSLSDISALDKFKIKKINM